MKILAKSKGGNVSDRPTEAGGNAVSRQTEMSYEAEQLGETAQQVEAPDSSRTAHRLTSPRCVIRSIGERPGSVAGPATKDFKPRVDEMPARSTAFVRSAKVVVQNRLSTAFGFLPALVLRPTWSENRVPVPLRMVGLTRTEDFNGCRNGVIELLGVFRGGVQLRQRERAVLPKSLIDRPNVSSLSLQRKSRLWNSSSVTSR